MRRSQLFLLLPFVSHKGCVLAGSGILVERTTTQTLSGNPTATCNPTTQELDDMWAGYPSACTFDCHLNTWQNSRCSVGASCGCGDCLSLDHVCLCATNNYVVEVFYCIGYNCTEAEQEQAASVASGCDIYTNGAQVVSDVSMAYASGIAHSPKRLTSCR
jgi:hypothetical protein